MGFFQLIHQHQTIGAAANRLRQLAAFLIADVPGRRADQAGDRLLFHIFRHVQPDHGVPAAVDLLRQRPAQLRLSHAGGSREQQARNGPRPVPDAAVAPAHRFGHGADSFALPHHLRGQQSFQPQQPFPFPGGEPPHGNSRPGGDHPRNVRPGDAPGAFSVGGLRQVLHFVPQFGGLFKFPFPYRFVQLLLQLFSGRAAPGQLHFLHPRPGSALVQQIDGFVRQIQVGQIPPGQAHRLLHRFLGNPQMVVPFQPRLQRPENRKRCLLPRLLHHHRAEPALQRGVLFNILPVFLPGRRAQHLQLAPTQRGLEDVRRVNGALGRARADDGVHFIDEKNHVSAAADFPQHVPQTFLEFAPVLGSGNQRRHVQTHQPFVLQLGRHVAHRHPLGKPLGNGGFSHPRLADQCGVILVFPAQNADDRVDLPFSPDHRVHA